MVKVYYATTWVSGYSQYEVVLLDDTVETELGLINSGYFAEIKEPEGGDAQRTD